MKLKILYLILMCFVSISFSQTQIPKNIIHPKIPNDGSTDGKFSVMIYYNPIDGRYYYYNPSGIAVSVEFPDSIKIFGIVSIPDDAISIVSEENSSSTPLNGGSSFIGEWMETSLYTNVSIMVSSDAASDVDGLIFQQSVNGTDVDDTDTFTLEAGAKKQFTFGIASKYIRVVYTNGAVNQTSFRLQTILHKNAPKSSSHRISDSIVDEDDAELVKAILAGKNPAGNFVNFSSTTAGNFKVSIEEYDPNSGEFATEEWAGNSLTVSTEVDSIDAPGTVWWSIDVVSVEDTLEFCFNRSFTTARRLFPNQSKYIEKISVDEFPKIYIRRKGSYGSCIYDIDTIGY
jgi:hypothetical protein